MRIRNPAPDTHIVGPPGTGSGSTSQRYGSGSFYHNVKIIRKTLIPTILNLDSYYFVTLFNFLSLKNDVNVPSKTGFRIRIRINLSCWIRIRIRSQIEDPDPDPGGQK